MDIQNRLLASLGAADLTHLRRHLREIPIEQGETLEEPGHSVEAVYFPQTGMISLIVQMPEDSSVEVSTVDKKADPTEDEALYITTGPTGRGGPAPQYACTASPVVSTSEIETVVKRIT